VIYKTLHRKLEIEQHGFTGMDVFVYFVFWGNNEKEYFEGTQYFFCTTIIVIAY
jgi:hypothetical protein